MNGRSDPRVPNLGAARAEADSRMLDEAFLETNDFRALRDTDHYNFVVGRRGTGKTAFFLRLIKEFKEHSHIFCHQLKPQEHDALSLLGALRKLELKSYASIRPTTRMLWRIAMLISVANDLCCHWKYRTRVDAHWLRSYLDEKKNLIARNELQRCTELLKQASVGNSSIEQIPGKIATTYQLNSLEKEVRQGLETVGARAVFLFDGLDEGWVPDASATAVLGGLAVAVSGFIDNDVFIQGKLFIRDNIFRFLAALDDDFSRHIEGNTLRLNWTRDSLLNLIASRLRVIFELYSVENNIRVWNRFAHRELRGRDGFLRCLQHTLYRPRDLLVLLNQAAVHAAREGRQGIVDSDVEEMSRQISQDRLRDLLKEYKNVFPGLAHLVKNFSGVQAFRTPAEVRTQLDDLIEEEVYSSIETSDIAVLKTSSQIIDALYSVGFLGLEDSGTGTVLFCHDGALSDISGSTEDHRIAIHPCYWKALDVTDTDVATEVLIEIHDDYESRANPQISDIRTRRLGQLVSELPVCPEGRQGARIFEEWVLQTCKILFAGSLTNFELHPASDGVQRRDVVATNQAERGSWKRILEDYKCRHVIFEAKNFEVLGPDDFRQALSYSGNHFGKLVIIVNRTDGEGMSGNTRGWIKEIWDQHRVVILTLPTTILTRCLSKIRNPTKRDYTERSLLKRLDTFERSYLSMFHASKNRKRRESKRRRS